MDSMLTTLIQIPFLAAFIWFSLKLQNEFRNDVKERESRWMEFLRQERDERGEALSNLTETLVSLTKEMVDHTAGSEERHRHIAATLESLHRRLDEGAGCRNFQPQLEPNKPQHLKG